MKVRFHYLPIMGTKETAMRTLASIGLLTLVAAVSGFSQPPRPPKATPGTAKPAGRQDQPVRLPASPITGSVFTLDQPAKTVKDENAPTGSPALRAPGSLIDLTGQSPLVLSPLTGSVLA